MNFGTSEYVTVGGSAVAQSLVDISDTNTFPALPTARRTRTHQSGSAEYGSRILKLHESTSFPLDDDIAVAVAASLLEADRAVVRCNALSYSQVARLGEPLVLLGVSRDPKVYHEALKSCIELQPQRDRLDASGKSFALPGGGYAFVRPEQYAPAMKALELFKITITPHHVLASQEYENAILAVIRIQVKRTFLHIKVPSSSLSTSNAHCVVSTTDAHGGKNPRRI